MASKTEYSVRCHCGNVKGRFRCDPTKILVLDCNCSDCYMRQNVHYVVPACDFNDESLEDSTTLHQWGTKQAIRRFCKTCGILPWYVPRSNPDGIALTINCVDWTKGGSEPAPSIKIEKFDGRNWEESFKALNDERREVRISDLSKKQT